MTLFRPRSRGGGCLKTEKPRSKETAAVCHAGGRVLQRGHKDEVRLSRACCQGLAEAVPSGTGTTEILIVCSFSFKERPGNVNPVCPVCLC